MARVIVKIQLPLVSNDPNPPMLIYDKNQAHVTHCLKKKVRKKMEATGKVKAFFYADWHHKAGEWNIHDEAPTQGW